MIQTYQAIPYKARRPVAFRAVSEKAIVNDRWTSTGQHVLHTAVHEMHICISAIDRKRACAVLCIIDRYHTMEPVKVTTLPIFEHLSTFPNLRTIFYFQI